MNIMKTLVFKLKKLALQTYFFILGLALFNLGIYLLFNFKFGITTTGIIFVILALIINSEKKGGK